MSFHHYKYLKYANTVHEDSERHVTGPTAEKVGERGGHFAAFLYHNSRVLPLVAVRHSRPQTC